MAHRLPLNKKTKARIASNRVDYWKYIESKAWKKRREWAFRKLGRCCRDCRSKDDLHVHHKHYRRLGRERLKDLEILCFDCHSIRHEDKYRSCDSMSIEYRKIVGWIPLWGSMVIAPDRGGA